jgi:uncharacterized OB-fold protein
MTTALPAPDPIVTAETEPYWTAAAQGRLVLPRCTACTNVIWLPKGFCPACGSLDVEWFDAAGTGTVYSYSIPRRGRGQYGAAMPYVLAYVELDEGPRMITNIVGCDVDDVHIGMPVTVVFDPTKSGHALPRFRPAESTPTA